MTPSIDPARQSEIVYLRELALLADKVASKDGNFLAWAKNKYPEFKRLTNRVYSNWRSNFPWNKFLEFASGTMALEEPLAKQAEVLIKYRGKVRPPASYNLNLRLLWLFSSGMRWEYPFWLVRPALLDALLLSQPPKTIRVEDFSQMGFPVCTFLLPKNAFRAKGESIDFITLAYVESEEGILIPSKEKGKPEYMLYGPANDKDEKAFIIAASNYDSGVVWSCYEPFDSNGEFQLGSLHMVECIGESSTLAQGRNREMVENMRYTGVMSEAFIGALDESHAAATVDENDNARLMQICGLGVQLACMMSYNSKLTSEGGKRGMVKKSGKEKWEPRVLGENYAMRKITEKSVQVKGSHASPRSHFRSGHNRDQRYGPKLSQIRRIWIEPVLVNAE